MARKAFSFLRVLSLYESTQGLYELLCRIDFAGIRRAHLQYNVYGEVRPAGHGYLPAEGARDYLDDLLNEPCFQKDILLHLVKALFDRSDRHRSEAADRRLIRPPPQSATDRKVCFSLSFYSAIGP
jgi:hypothetical protein